MLKNLVVVLVVVLMFVVGGCANSQSTRFPSLNWESHSRLILNGGETEGAIALSGNPELLTEVVKRPNTAPNPVTTPRSAVTSDGGSGPVARAEKALGM
ncbi:hypothetical protein KKE19_01850 [Patescibacteria group bacterium]|nr:hypothetical protein [Patescibacteria group bacterium]MBU4367441.1 hypothetical protein [Patescibacteria group bacterium]MBU4461761.1 hypothetical protein [Patescibacteria group bacterium]